MKEITKTEEEIVKKTITTYEAIDGTIFTDVNECHRYEATAEAVLLSKVNDFKLNEVDVEDVFEGGEGIYKVVVPAILEHIDILNQLWKLNGGQNKQDLLFNESDLNTVILVGVRFYDAAKIDWIWFYRVNEVISNITKNQYIIAKHD